MSPKHLVVFLAVVLLLTEVSLADPYESKKGHAVGKRPRVPSTATEVSLADPYESKIGTTPGGKRPRHPPTTTEVSLADPYESKKGSPLGGKPPRHPPTTTEVSVADPYESKKGSPRVGEPGRPRRPKDDSIDGDSISKAAGPGRKTNPPTKGPGGRRRCPKCSEFEAVDDEKNDNPFGGKPLTPGTKTNP